MDYKSTINLPATDFPMKADLSRREPDMLSWWESQGIYQKLRKAAAWGLVALYIAVFPANINMLMNDLPFNGQPVPPLFLWLRLPIQFVLIAWAYWLTRSDGGRTSDNR